MGNASLAGLTHPYGTDSLRLCLRPPSGTLFGVVSCIQNRIAVGGTENWFAQGRRDEAMSV